MLGKGFITGLISRPHPPCRCTGRETRRPALAGGSALKLQYTLILPPVNLSSPPLRVISQ